VAACAERIFTLPVVCVERGRYFTKAYQETEGAPPALRQATALAKTLDNMSIRISEGELIVGYPSSKERGGAVLPEINAQWLYSEIDNIPVRQWDRFEQPTADERGEILAMLPYWKGRSLFDIWQKHLPARLRELLDSGFVGGVTFGTNGFYPGHVAVDFEMVLTQGLCGRYQKAIEATEALDLLREENLPKYYFYQAVTIALDAVRRFSLRYAQLAREQATAEADSVRQQELLEIGRICEKVPWQPAETFHEAVQATYMVWLALMVEGWGHGLTLGRADQYLHSYYMADLASGRISREGALELLELLFIKLNTTVTIDDSNTATCFAGFPQAVNITLGGIKQDGSSAINELTYLLMEAERDIGMTAEDLVIRVSENSPRGYLRAAAELAKDLKGKLKFVSDPVAIAQLCADGYPERLAREYIITGCNSPCVPGVSLDVPGGLFNLAFMLELALNDGISRVTGKQVGLRTGNPRAFAGFEDVWNAFCEQTRHFIAVLAVVTNVDREVFIQHLAVPLQSALFQGPMERGCDLFNGGTGQLSRQAFSLAAAPNVGDSLAAIKRVVFEKKQATMHELIDALDQNFDGYEKLLYLFQRAPKFGNGDAYVDDLVNRVLGFCSDTAHAHMGRCGTPLIVAAATITSNVPLGLGVGALPDGRLAGMPLAEGGISPHQGRNTSGPTPTMRSVAGLCHKKLTNGSVLNMRFDPAVIKSRANIEKFVDLFRAYLLGGGFFVQFNIIDTETLREAQKHPEQYQDLLVRVATYSAYFVELSPDMQEDIINRMEFKVL